MKIILAIFAIACTVAFLFLGNDHSATLNPDIRPLAVAEADIAPSPQGANDPAPAQASNTSPQAGKGDDLLRIAAERLDQYGSLAALLRYRIVMFDCELIGSGLYQQAGQGSQRRFRLELKTQLGDKPTSMIHVCDSETLWMYRERSGQSQLERLDLRRVRAAQNEVMQNETARNELRLSASPIEETATGGLIKLIDGLRNCFEPIRANPGYLNDMPVWAIELEWRSSALAELIPDQQLTHTRPGDLFMLPQIPERVLLCLGHEDLFPRRIEFRKRPSQGLAERGAGQGRAGENVPAVSVDFTDVRFNQPIDPREFHYGAAGAVDVTEAFLRRRALSGVR